MLIQDYNYYLTKILLDGMISMFGILSILLLIVAFVALVVMRDKGSLLRIPVFLLMLSLAIASFINAFYSASYEFEEHPETIVFESLPAGEPNCGTAWTRWIKGAYGLSNPCPPGCFRGQVLRKQLSMSGFPPWPMYKRELQCWTRDAVN